MYDRGLGQAIRIKGKKKHISTPSHLPSNLTEYSNSHQAHYVILNSWKLNSASSSSLKLASEEITGETRSNLNSFSIKAKSNNKRKNDRAIENWNSCNFLSNNPGCYLTRHPTCISKDHHYNNFLYQLATLLNKNFHLHCKILQQVLALMCTKHRRSACKIFKD